MMLCSNVLFTDDRLESRPTSIRVQLACSFRSELLFFSDYLVTQDFHNEYTGK